MEHVHGSHDMSLVVVSFVIVFMTSLTALDIVRRVNLSIGWRRKAWLLSGSVAMGIGIWSMHFIAMLAFELSVPIAYNNNLVALSVIVAIVASLCGLYFGSKTDANSTKLVVGGMIMGIGISGMHYIGMAAMVGVSVAYNPFLFTLSIFTAIGASTIALVLAFQFRDSEKGIGTSAKIISGAVMGIGIAGTHYIGMAATTYSVVPIDIEKVTTSFLDTEKMFIAITFSAIVILGIVLIISYVLDKKLDEQIAYKGAILESVLDCIIISDHQGKIIECNPSVTRTFGYSRENLIGKHMESYLLLYSLPTDPADGKVRKNKRIETTGIRFNGEEFPIEITIRKMKKSGFPTFTIYVLDITRFKMAEKTIKELAYRDSLTGLSNRRCFYEMLDEAIQEAESKNIKLAVLYLDLDRFKMINDSLGHAFGDLLLMKIGERLEKEMGNNGLVFRNGGDEFTILLKNTVEEEVERQAKAIIYSLSRPVYLEEHEVYVTASVGISMYPEDGTKQEVLVKNADIAMYDAKEHGKNSYSFYRQVTGLKTSQSLRLENELRSALDRNEFVLYYQPRMNIHSKQIVGVEALIRWNHPELGTIGPNEFIAQAEASGLIIPIGNWVLRTAIAQCKRWNENSLPMEMSVNLSAVQFQNPNLVKEISEMLEEEGTDPTLLNLEITENMMMDADISIQILRDLKQLGVTISLDDFGTGYNSLSSLKNMPIDDIKIDRSFIGNVTNDPGNAAIVTAIISIGHSLKMNVIAEGVETQGQLLFLERLGCHEMQGYLLSPAIPAEDFERLYVKALV